MARGKLDPNELYKLKALQGVSLESVEGLLETCEVKTLEPGDLLLKFGQPNTRSELERGVLAKAVWKF